MTFENRVISSRGFNFKSIIQLALMLICSGVLFILSIFYHSDEWDPTSQKNFIPSDVNLEIDRSIKMNKELLVVYDKIRYAINHPVPELHSGLNKGPGSINDTKFGTAFSSINREKEKKKHTSRRRI